METILMALAPYADDFSMVSVSNHFGVAEFGVTASTPLAKARHLQLCLDEIHDAGILRAKLRSFFEG